MLKKRKFLIGGIIVFVAISYLGYAGFQGSTTYYYTVSELLELGKSIYGVNVRVNGDVTDGSVKQEPGSFKLRFTINDEENTLPVVYQGVVPDAFKAGSEVVVEGHIDSAGVFQASTIMTKCPSKYEPEK